MTLYAFRHPKARGAAGRCIGHTDLPVDPRKAKNLAHRIRALQRRQGLPQEVLTSDLQRAAAVGRCLRRWGWRHRMEPALRELNFGAWDGRAWTDIPEAEISAWADDLARHAPGGGGESVRQLLARFDAFVPGGARLLVTHGGWLSALQWRLRALPGEPVAGNWPAPPRHGACLPASCF